MADLLGRAAQAASQRIADSEATTSNRDMNSAITGTHIDHAAWVTVREAARQLQCKEGYVRQTAAEMCAAGVEGQPVKLGAWRIYVEPMRDFIAAKTSDSVKDSCYLRPQPAHRTKTLYGPNETWELKDDVS